MRHHRQIVGLPVALRERWVVAALVAVITAITAGARLASWYGSWGETGAALDSTTTISYPVLAAAAAWIASEPRRKRYQTMISASSRRIWSVPVRATLALGSVAAGGALLVVIVMWLLTAAAANFGSVPLLELVVVVCGFIATAGFGVFVGSVFPSLVAPVAAVVTVYGAEYLADTGKPSLYPLAGLVVADSRERTYRETMLWVLGVRSIWLLALAILFATLATRAASLWLLPFSLVCATATPLLAVGDAGMRIDPAALREICGSHGNVEVCMTAARSHVANDVYRAVNSDLQALNGINPGKVVLIEETIAPEPTATLRDGVLTIPFGVVNGLEGDAHMVNARDLQLQVTSTLLRSNCRLAPPTENSGPPKATPADVIQAWMLKKTGIPIDGTAALGSPALLPGQLDYTPVEGFRHAWDSATDDRREAWLIRNREKLISCTLDATDFEL